MTKYYEYTITRPYQKEWMDAWVKAEAHLGLHNSFFLIKDGMVEQYVDGEESEKFHKFVKNIGEEFFNDLCESFFQAIKDKDKVEMFYALTIFDEMDNYNLGTPAMKIRLKRVRETTHEISYKI